MEAAIDDEAAPMETAAFPDSHEALHHAISNSPSSLDDAVSVSPKQQDAPPESASSVSLVAEEVLGEVVLESASEGAPRPEQGGAELPRRTLSKLEQAGPDQTVNSEPATPKELSMQTGPPSLAQVSRSESTTSSRASTPAASVQFLQSQMDAGVGGALSPHLSSPTLPIVNGLGFAVPRLHHNSHRLALSTEEVASTAASSDSGDTFHSEAGVRGLHQVPGSLSMGRLPGSFHQVGVASPSGAGQEGTGGRKHSTAQCRREMLKLVEEREDAERSLGKAREQMRVLRAEHEALAAAHRRQEQQLQEAQEERDSAVRRMHAQQGETLVVTVPGQDEEVEVLRRENHVLTRQLKEQQEESARQAAADRDLLGTYRVQLEKASVQRRELEEAVVANAGLRRQFAALEAQMQRMPHLEAQLQLFREEAKHEAALKEQAMRELEEVQRENEVLRKEGTAAQLAAEEVRAQAQKLQMGVLGSLDSALKELRDENEDLRAKAAAAQSRAEESWRRADELEGEVRECARKVETSLREAARWRNEAAEEGRRAEEARERMEERERANEREWNEEREMLMGQVRASEGERDVAMERAARVQETLEAAEGRRRAFMAEVERWRVEAESAQKRVAQDLRAAEERCVAVQRDCEGLGDKLVELEKERERTKEEAEEMKAGKEALEVLLEQARGEAERVRGELGEVTSALEEARAECAMWCERAEEAEREFDVAQAESDTWRRVANAAEQRLAEGQPGPGTAGMVETAHAGSRDLESLEEQVKELQERLEAAESAAAGAVSQAQGQEKREMEQRLEEAQEAARKADGALCHMREEMVKSHKAWSSEMTMLLHAKDELEAKVLAADMAQLQLESEKERLKTSLEDARAALKAAQSKQRPDTPGKKRAEEERKREEDKREQQLKAARKEVARLRQLLEKQVTSASEAASRGTEAGAPGAGAAHAPVLKEVEALRAELEKEKKLRAQAEEQAKQLAATQHQKRRAVTGSPSSSPAHQGNGARAGALPGSPGTSRPASPRARPSTGDAPAFRTPSPRKVSSRDGLDGAETGPGSESEVGGVGGANEVNAKKRSKVAPGGSMSADRRPMQSNLQNENSALLQQLRIVRQRLEDMEGREEQGERELSRARATIASLEHQLKDSTAKVSRVEHRLKQEREQFRAEQKLMSAAFYDVNLELLHIARSAGLVHEQRQQPSSQPMRGIL